MIMSEPKDLHSSTVAKASLENKCSPNLTLNLMPSKRRAKLEEPLHPYSSGSTCPESASGIYCPGEYPDCASGACRDLGGLCQAG
jgi:hypothetical protein